jgi:hypothetical protein
MLKSSLLQRQLKINADVLTGLYEEIAKLRAARKAYNERADEAVSEEFGTANREQAAVYTPYIRKFKKKIAAVEEIQRMLKSELKGQQSIEAWAVEDDAFWLQQAEIAKQDGFKVYSYDEMAEMFGETE